MPDEDEYAVCPACEEWIPGDRLDLHLDGLDGARPECPRQDLELIVQQAQRAQYIKQRLPWARLMSGESLW